MNQVLLLSKVLAPDPSTGYCGETSTAGYISVAREISDSDVNFIYIQNFFEELKQRVGN